MATASSSSLRSTEASHSVSVLRLLVAGGATAVVVFVLCWVGTFIPFTSPTHAYISLFTSAEIGSAKALAEGSIWSLLFGSLVAALFAMIYNAAAPLAPK